MIIAKKIRCLPTKEQLELFKKSAGVSRFVYNLMIYENTENYSFSKRHNLESSFINEREIRKFITKIKKLEEYSWLKEVSANIPKQSAKDCQEAFNKFLKKEKGYPKYKKKNHKQSFYVNYESFKSVGYGFKGEKLGIVKTVEEIPKCDIYHNPRMVYDNKYWYITFGIDVEEQTQKLNDFSLGIDLGIKNFVTTSQNESFSNINKTKKVRKLNKRIKLYQRKLSKKEKGSANRNKNIKKLQLLHRKVKNIRLNYIHQITSYIVKTKPYKIVVEYLRVSNMLKNKKLSKEISECGFYEFRRQMEYKSKLNGIEFVLANTFFPSSKLCSCCGNKKQDLKLSDRIYKCEKCGIEIDRDYNASLNLSRL